MEAVTLDSPAGDIHVARWRPDTADAGRSPIVLLHDSLGCVALWRDFPARLADASGREVFAYDRLGFGRSDPYPGRLPLSFIDDEARGAFAAVRDHLKRERFVLFGHSVGGGMAIEAAAQHPESCEGLITVAAQAYMEPRILAGIREAEQSFTDPDQLARLARYHGDKAEWVLRAWVDTWQTEAFANWNLAPTLARVHCPTLAIHGEQDEFGSPDQARYIAERSAGPSGARILPCGHVPHRECPERLIAAVEGFLADLPKR
ncbi:alpha/beta fold hydrolase [Halomonas cerina]|uniref:Pimeloyl-ACP methyl ester carboxylesterase n=1 Tax=Halomonas cerina TaxID=447424 RepID=A0A839V0L2_9GAMM|nr:alpha/beta hydrolase [Halomonas cerina]MBB3189303.1 pimeloyl-ACP methyl ester carboxylesterase [Halomonas cerina]